MSGSSFSSAEEKLEWFMARDAVEVSMSEERQDLGNNGMLSWCRALQSPSPEGCCYPTHELLGLEVCTEKQTCGNVPVPWGDKGGLWGGCSCPLGTRWTEGTCWQDDYPVLLLDAIHGGQGEEDISFENGYLRNCT